MVDINDFSSVYHLHIPRTAGIFLKKHLVEEFEIKQNKNVFANHRKPLDDNYLKSCYFVAGHFGKYPIDKMNNPLVFSVLRDPVERFISYYKYTRHLFPQFKDNELLDYWLYDERLSSLHSNTQFKFLTGSIDVEKYNKYLVDQRTVEENWFIKNYSSSVDDAISFIDNNIILTLDNPELMTKSLENILKISPFPNLYKFNTSDKSDFGITKSQYDRIVELNQLDLEIYEYARKTQKKY
jgi:hypothetical protein